MLDKSEKFKALQALTNQPTTSTLEQIIRDIQKDPKLCAYEVSNQLGRESHFTAHLDEQGQARNFLTIRMSVINYLCIIFKDGNNNIKGFKKCFPKYVWAAIKLISIYQANKAKQLYINCLEDAAKWCGIDRKEVARFLNLLDSTTLMSIVSQNKARYGLGKEYTDTTVEFCFMGNTGNEKCIYINQQMIQKVVTNEWEAAPLLTWLLLDCEFIKLGQPTFFMYKESIKFGGEYHQVTDFNAKFHWNRRTTQNHIKYLETIGLATHLLVDETSKKNNCKYKVNYLILHGMRESSPDLTIPYKLYDQFYRNELLMEEYQRENPLGTKSTRGKTVPFGLESYVDRVMSDLERKIHSARNRHHINKSLSTNKCISEDNTGKTDNLDKTDKPTDIERDQKDQQDEQIREKLCYQEGVWYLSDAGSIKVLDYQQVLGCYRWLEGRIGELQDGKWHDVYSYKVECDVPVNVRELIDKALGDLNKQIMMSDKEIAHG